MIAPLLIVLDLLPQALVFSFIVSSYQIQSFQKPYPSVPYSIAYLEAKTTFICSSQHIFHPSCSALMGTFLLQLDNVTTRASAGWNRTYDHGM
jgi:hypothetical protein